MQKILNLPFVDNEDFYPLCQAYTSLVSHWNTIINLVSPLDVDNLLNNLIVQSVQPLSKEPVPAGARVLDVGSGAGIPGFPLKFARPDIKLTLIESRRKKTLFLNRVVQDLELKDVEVVRSRLEEISTRQDWQAAFDLITTRGTGRAPDLYPLMEPLLRPGGACWFFKGIAGPKEAKELKRLYKDSVEVLEIGKNLSVIILKT